MPEWGWCLITFIVGGLFGTVIMAVMCVNNIAERECDD